MMRKLALTLLVGTALSPVLFAPGCGGTSSPVDAGKDAKDGGNDAKAGTGGGAGTSGGAGSTAGTTGASGMDGGAAGMDAAAGTGVPDASPDTAPDLSPMIDTALPDLTPDGSQSKSWLFATTTEGWTYTKYGSTPNANAADNLATISGAPVWDGTNDADNSATSGSLKGTVLFKHEGDRIDFQAFSVAAGAYNWVGYKISAKVKLVSGGNIAAGCPLTAWLYVSARAPSYDSPPGPVTALQTGSWVTLTYDLTNNVPIDLTTVSQMGIQITTGPACGGSADGGADGGVDGADGGDGGVDGSDAAADVLADGGSDAVDAATDLLVDAGLGDVIVATDASDASDAVVIPVTATTAVILIDNVIVSVK